MTTSAIVLILAVLFLGGIIAALGDRLGTKIGKARLRLFNLRPRQTAIIVTVLTGTLIAASTLGILFALSENLRQGVFSIDEIRKQRRKAQEELLKVNQQKNLVEQELFLARTEKAQIEQRLAQINQDFRETQSQLTLASQQAASLKEDVQSLLAEREQLFELREQLKRQVEEFKQELVKQSEQIKAQTLILQEKQAHIQELEKQQSALQAVIAERDQKITELDQEIKEKNKDVQRQQLKLQELQSEITYLQREVKVLQQYYENYQDLRERKIALVRGQILAFNTVRIIDQDAVQEAINYLLRQANQTAIEAVEPSNSQKNQRIVQITQSQVQQLTRQIEDGQEYVVRILSAGNYVKGEKEVRVFADVVLNQEIFPEGEELAGVSIDSQNIDQQQLQDRLDWLLAASEFRARRAGVLGTIQVEDGRFTTIARFLEEIRQSEQPIDEIRAIVEETTYSSGPLKLRLIALVNGEEVIST